MLAFNSHLVANIKDPCSASDMLHLDLHRHQLKGGGDCELLHRVPQLPCVILANTMFILEHLWEQEWEQEEKQGNG